jgi:hypothetical protein
MGDRGSAGRRGRTPPGYRAGRDPPAGPGLHRPHVRYHAPCAEPRSPAGSGRARAGAGRPGAGGSGRPSRRPGGPRSGGSSRRRSGCWRLDVKTEGAGQAAVSIKLWAERRLGEILRMMAENGTRAMHSGRRQKNESSRNDSFSLPTLKDLKITKDESARAQRWAGMPEAAFTTAVAQLADRTWQSAARSYWRPCRRRRGDAGWLQGSE